MKYDRRINSNENFYDLEIINLIKPDPRYPELKYCGGWRDFSGMGISVGGYAINRQEVDAILFDFDVNLPMKTGEYFMNLLLNAHEIIGFNSKNFDDNLLAVNGIPCHTTFDLLEEIRIAAFGSPNWQDQPRGYSYRLEALAQANLNFSKTGSGELAPVLWQQGKYQQVIDYCKNDVELLRSLYFLFMAGKLKDPNTGNLLRPNS